MVKSYFAGSYAGINSHRKDKEGTEGVNQCLPSLSMFCQDFEWI